MQTVTVLGATGSIGRSALSVLAQHSGEYRVRALAGGSRVAELARACAACRPEIAAIADGSRYAELKAALAAVSPATKAVAGEDAVEALAADAAADQVLVAVSGAAALRPAFAAARAGKRMLLANKESVVCGGALLMEAVRAGGATLLPVDSEHSAVFQCLAGADAATRAAASIILTCSGGPFRNRKDLSGVTPEQALAHPNWSMGPKITVDSASLMNKGLEVIEARWLFDMPESRIEVLVHPQSIVHSAVRFGDGAVIAQLGVADMRVPIAYALGFPTRIASGARRLDFLAMPTMTFEKPDTARFPHLAMAYEALAAGGSATAVLNAANEEAVAAFLRGEISFVAMAGVCREALSRALPAAPRSLEDILEADRFGRRAAREAIGGRAWN